MYSGASVGLFGPTIQSSLSLSGPTAIQGTPLAPKLAEAGKLAGPNLNLATASSRTDPRRLESDASMGYILSGTAARLKRNASFLLLAQLPPWR